MTHPVLTVENLAVSFATRAEEVPAVRGIDFHLDEGEALGIVGESGSGKTVTCRALLRERDDGNYRQLDHWEPG